MITEKQSNTLYVIKAFAILSVIAAHMPFGAQHPTADLVRNALGQIGVIVFFIVSGFLYKRTFGDTKTFWIKKLKGIVIPWIIFSVITFAFSCVLSHSFYIASLPKWILGFGTWYWFVPILLICFALFKYLDNEVSLCLAVVLSAVSVILMSFGILKCNDLFTQYTNIFNWIGFFALGILLRKHEKLDSLLGVLPCSISALLLVCFVTLSVWCKLDKSYINYLSIPIEISGFITLLNISSLLKKSKLLMEIGKKSYFIYLIQMQVAGIINTRLPYTPLFFVLRPFIVLAVLYIAAFAISYILRKIKLDKYAYIIALK